MDRCPVGHRRTSRWANGPKPAAAREGIDRGRDTGSRYSEASAQIALAQILLATEGDVPRAEIEAALDRAAELVAVIEGRSLSPRWNSTAASPPLSATGRGPSRRCAKRWTSIAP
jgi:hypothetical protein